MAVLRTPLIPGPLAVFDDASAETRDSERVALAGLYARHATQIHRFLRDLLGDTALAADATQETFCRAFRRLGSLEDQSRVAPWLFAIARNVSLELRKARHRAGRVFVADDGAREAVWLRSPEMDLLDQESLRIVATALGRLAEDRRAALLLRLDHGLAYDDIATAMGWSLAKVKVEIFRAREVLRATLDEYRRGGAR